MKHVELFAPAEFWRLAPDELASMTNGCGTRGIIGAIVPDRIWGLSITPACNIHDFMYRGGRTICDKEESDRVFLNNMLRLIDARSGNKLTMLLRCARAVTYYFAVKFLGGPAFWNGKNNSDELRRI